MDRFRVLTLNLRHGGGARHEAITDYLLASSADAIVCTEFRNGATGNRIAARMKASGYSFHPNSAAAPHQNSVGIFTRTEGRIVDLSPPESDRHRVLALEVNALHLIGVYFATGATKASLFRYLHALPDQMDRPCLLIGDFNTGLPYLDENGATLPCRDMFAGLNDCGWRDLWRQSFRDGREASWQSRLGNGFRIDHAFACGDLKRWATRCYYDHSTREGLSDHSALLCEISN